MGKFQKLLFYAGIEPEDYAEVQPEILQDNRKKLRIYLAIACFFLLVVTILAGIVEPLRANGLLYGVGFAICLVLLALEMAFPEQNGLFLKWLMYAFAALLYALGIVVALHSPQDLSVSFVAFLLAVPLLFVMPPFQHILNVLFFVTVFILLALRLENGRVLILDIVDCVVFGAVSCIISTIMMHSMHQNFVTRSKLQESATHDLLTGLQNRNAYEDGRMAWISRCELSLSCVYVDANGLHEMNNAKGHEQGDQMLREVARCMRLLFGKGHCYRIGGDEFVAFVPDRQYAAVRLSAEELSHAMALKGYAVAVGVATQSAGGIDLDALIKQAETRMYYAKQEYYRTHTVR